MIAQRRGKQGVWIAEASLLVDMPEKARPPRRLNVRRRDLIAPGAIGFGRAGGISWPVTGVVRREHEKSCAAWTDDPDATRIDT